MTHLQSIVLAFALLIPFNVFSDEPEISEDTKVICEALALDAVSIGKVYVKNHDEEEAAKWVVDRIASDPTFLIFAPGDLQIIMTMKSVTIEFEDIPRFAMAVFKTCTLDDTEGWVQPYNPDSVLTLPNNDSTKIAM